MWNLWRNPFEPTFRVLRKLLEHVTDANATVDLKSTPDKETAWMLYRRLMKTNWLVITPASLPDSWVNVLILYQGMMHRQTGDQLTTQARGSIEESRKFSLHCTNHPCSRYHPQGELGTRGSWFFLTFQYFLFSKSQWSWKSLYMFAVWSHWLHHLSPLRRKNGEMREWSGSGVTP